MLFQTPMLYVRVDIVELNNVADIIGHVSLRPAPSRNSRTPELTEREEAHQASKLTNDIRAITTSVE
jgi:hypothetical protein